MGLKIDVRLELSPRQKGLLRVAVVTGGCIAALGLGVAVGAPHEWKSNDALTASDLNSLNVARSDAGATSVGATLVCGATATTYTGNAGGYKGVKQACENACKSPTAHVCMGEEIARTLSLGRDFSGQYTGYGWYASATYSRYGVDAMNDCNGWQSPAADKWATAWFNQGAGQQGYPTNEACSASHAFLCCD